MSATLMNFLDQTVCMRLTQALAHFLWEGLLIGLCAGALARLCRTARAQVRYGIHAVSLALMALCLPITYAFIAAPDLPPVARAAVADTAVAHGRAASQARSESVASVADPGT